jgi:hypothetical protein
MSQQQNNNSNSLANRLAANQQQQSGSNNNAPSANQPRSPFGRSNSTPPARFGQQNMRTWIMQPMHKTVVRFELKGLGDPFYRLLGSEMNPEYGDYKAVSAALEKRVERTGDLEALLNSAWASYKLQGATLVYNWNGDMWKALNTPPVQQSENEDESQQNPLPAPITFTCLRAIDLQLVLNVLARSRSQVLLTRAPLVFSQEYLNRSLMSDDPRLVALAKATGFLEEG